MDRVEKRDEAKDEKETTFIDAVSRKNGGSKFMFKIYVYELVKIFNFVIDSGADVTCISLDDVPENYRNKIRPSKKAILGPDGKRLALCRHKYKSKSR